MKSKVLKSILVLCLLVVGIGNAWGFEAETTIDGIRYKVHYGAGTEYAEVLGLTEGSNLTTLVLPETFSYKATLSYTVKVSVIAANAFKDNTTLTSVTLTSKIDEIHSGAFAGCTGLTSLSIPTSVTTIDEGAFAGVKGVTLESGNKKFTMEDGMLYNSGKTTLYYCDPTKEKIELPYANLSSIANYAFSGCTGDIYSYKLTPVTTSENTFSGLSTSSKVYVPWGSSQKYTGNWAACTIVERKHPNQIYYKTNGKSDFGIGVYETKSHASFNGLTKLGVEEFDLNEKVNNKTCEWGAFTFAETVTFIPANAFEKCHDLNEVIISSDVDSIATSAFSECTGLTKVEIESGVQKIGNKAFNGCTSLVTVNIPASVTKIEQSAFENCFNNDDTTLGEATVTFDGPRSEALVIEDWAFTKCDNLKTIVVPDNTTLGEGVFCNCPNMSNVTLPSTLTSLKKDVFKQCPKLESLTLPASIESIDAKAFDLTENLKNVALSSIPAGIEYLPTGCSATIALTDASAIGATSFTAGTLTYTRNVGSTYWGTLMLPFPLVSNENIQYYQLTSVNDATKVLTFSQVANVEANTPCVYKILNGASELTFTGTGETIDTSEGNKKTSGTTSWVMKGTYGKVVKDQIYYFTKDNTYKYGAAGSQITFKPFRAWFEAAAPSSNGQSVRYTFVEVEDEATGIETVQVKVESQEVYDLSGRRLSAPKGGMINIVNGKKAVVK